MTVGGQKHDAQGNITSNALFKSMDFDPALEPQQFQTWHTNAKTVIRLHVGPAAHDGNFWLDCDEDGDFDAAFYCPTEHLDEDDFAAELTKFGECAIGLTQVCAWQENLKAIFEAEDDNQDVCRLLARLKHKYAAVDVTAVTTSLNNAQNIAAWSEADEKPPTALATAVRNTLTVGVMQRATHGKMRLTAMNNKLTDATYREASIAAFKNAEHDPINDAQELIRFEAAAKAVDAKYHSRKVLGNAEDEPTRVFNAGANQRSENEIWRDAEAYFTEQGYRGGGKGYRGGGGGGKGDWQKGKGKGKGKKGSKGKGKGAYKGDTRKDDDKKKCRWCGNMHHVSSCWFNPYNPPSVCKLSKTQKTLVIKDGRYSKEKHGRVSF